MSRRQRRPPRYNNRTRHDYNGATAQLQHIQTFNHYQDLLTNYALSRFDWVNLPTTINERFLEMSLFKNGMCVIFKPWFADNLIALPATQIGQCNIYGEPLTVKAQGVNGFSYDVDCADNGVLVWDNQNHRTMALIINKYAKALAEFDQTISINLNAQKTPIYISCPDEKVEQFMQISSMYQSGVPLFFGRDTAMAGSEITTISTNAPYIIDKLFVDKAKTLNEFFSSIGVDSANQDKKERLVESETSANNGQVELARLGGLTPRRRACDEVNARYSSLLTSPISCVYAHDNTSANYNYNNNTPMREGLSDGTVL